MTLITGHRGARNLWPENSPTGFRNVLALDVDAVEFDVHLTDAGELLVIHDATLDRTVEASGPVRALTPEARASHRLKDSQDVIPTLGEVLAILAPAKTKALHVEIKSGPDRNPYPGSLVETVAIHHELMDAEWELITDMLPLDRLCVWTLNDEILIGKWLDRGVGHLTTDSPDIALRLRAQRSTHDLQSQNPGEAQ